MKTTAWIGLFLLPVAGFAQQKEMGKELEEVARIATVMIDGDACRRIQTPRSREFLLKQDKRDPWIGSDNYDVDHQAFIQTKKTLIRLSRLAAQPCDVSLWMPVESQPSRVQIMVRNVNEMSQFWTWGAMHQPMFPEMKQVLETGQRVRVAKRPGMLSVLAPVYDSLGDIVGLVEVAGRDSPAAHENVK